MKITTTLAGTVLLVGAFGQSAFGGVLPEAPPVQKPIQLAQLSLEFGTSGSRIRRALRRQGYSEINITYRGFTKARAEACKGGQRLRLEVTPRGRVKNQTKIGDCRPPINAAEARRILRDQGYRKINIEEQGNIPFVAIACKRGEKYRININHYGDVKIDRELGRCRAFPSLEDIATLLRDEGYNRIRYTDRTPPRYQVEACRKGRKFELALNRLGEIRAKDRVGRCDPPIKARNLARSLADRGFDRVDIIDKTPPRYRAEACRNRDRVELTIGRYGQIIRQTKIGPCSPPINERQLVRQLKRQGFTNIRVVNSSNNEYETVACRKNDRMRINFNRYGEVIDQKRLGRCTSERLNNIVESYRDRGLKKVRVYIEACRRGRKIRFTLDAYGEQVGRERIGRCE